MSKYRVALSMHLIQMIEIEADTWEQACETAKKWSDKPSWKAMCDDQEPVIADTWIEKDGRWMQA